MDGLSGLLKDYDLLKSNQKFQIISNEEFARRIMKY